MVRIGHLPGERDPSVLAEGPGDGVLINHDLDAVGGAGPASFDIDDGGIIALLGDEVRLTAQRGGAAPQVEPVLSFGIDGIALALPFCSVLVELVPTGSLWRLFYIGWGISVLLRGMKVL